MTDQKPVRVSATDVQQILRRLSLRAAELALASIGGPGSAPTLCDIAVQASDAANRIRLPPVDSPSP